jgi:multiple sugar transport system substrate-binding protein
MKYIFLVIFAVLLGMSAVAWKMMPPPDPSGKQAIVWASDDNPSRREQIALFNQLHPDYKLQLDSVNSGMDKVITQSLSGVGPDVFDAAGSQLGLLADTGMLYDVTDQLKARGITLDQIWPVARPGISINGRIYGIPCNVSGDAIWFHKDIFDAEHIPYPPAKGWKWDDFVAVAQKLTQRDASGRVTRYGVMGLTYMDLIYTNGGRMLTPDGRKCVIDSPECIDAVQKWADLQLKYDVSPTPDEESSMSTQGGWGSGTITLFQDKRAAMAAGGRWWLCMLRNVKDKDGNFPFHLGVAEKPVTRYPRFWGGARVAFVNALSPHRDRAVEFLAYLCSNDYSDALNKQGDAMPALIKASDRPAYDYDPNHGQDCGNSPIWKELSRCAIAGELSPYITPTEINTILGNQMDQVRTGIKPPAAALHEAARRINQTIAVNIERDPELRKRYNNGDTSPVYGNFTDASLAAAAQSANPSPAPGESAQEAK